MTSRLACACTINALTWCHGDEAFLTTCGNSDKQNNVLHHTNCVISDLTQFHSTFCLTFYHKSRWKIRKSLHWVKSGTVWVQLREILWLHLDLCGRHTINLFIFASFSQLNDVISHCEIFALLLSPGRCIAIQLEKRSKCFSEENCQTRTSDRMI